MTMMIGIVKRTHLTLSECEQMYSVFSRYYDNVNRSRFERDLKEKNWVIILRNQDHTVVGFSTLQTYEHIGKLGVSRILYSGDTIMERVYRQNGHLAGAFGHFLIRTITEQPSAPIYWLLTSKGVRTYRFLPVFFKRFFPVFNQKTPAEIETLLNEIATAKFGDDYSPHTQIISRHGQRDWLCASEHDPQLLRRSDSHIQFFLQANPGYLHGDELACITEISEKNLNSLARRVIEHTAVQWYE